MVVYVLDTDNLCEEPDRPIPIKDNFTDVPEYKQVDQKISRSLNTMHDIWPHYETKDARVELISVVNNHNLAHNNNELYSTEASGNDEMYTDDFWASIVAAESESIRLDVLDVP